MMNAFDQLLSGLGSRLFQKPEGEKPPYDLYFWLILALAVIARMNRLGHELWADETFNWYVSKDGVATAIARINEDFFPPLYSVLLAVWLKLTNESALFLRLPSMAFGVATVYFVYRLAYLVNGAILARVAIVFIALSPIHIFWSQNARPFSMSALLVTVVLFVGYKIILAEISAKKPSLRTYSVLGLSLLCSALTTNTELIFVFVSFFFFAGMMYARVKRAALAPIIRLGLVYFAVFLLWMPQLPALLVQSEASVLSDFPFHNARWLSILTELRELFSLMAIWRFEWLQYTLHGLFFATGVWYFLRHKTVATRLLVLFGVLYPTVMLLLRILDPVFGQVIRRSLWLGPVWQIFVAAGLIALIRLLMSASIKRFHMQMKCAVSGVVVFIFLLHVWSIVSMQRNGLAFWSEAVPILAGKIQVGDVIMPVPGLQYTSHIYYSAPIIREAQIYYPEPFNRWHNANIPDYLAFLCSRSSTLPLNIWVAEETDGVYSNAISEAGWHIVEKHPVANGRRFLSQFRSPNSCESLS